MKRFLVHVSTLCITALLFAVIGCEDDLPTTQSVKGSITGNVALFKESIAIENHSGIPYGDNSGVTVSLEGTEYSTLSLADGTWVLENIPAGIYNIEFEKEGFAWNKLWNVQLVGNGTLEATPLIPVALFERPSSLVSSFSAEWFGIEHNGSAPYINVTGAISKPSPANGRLSVAIYFSTDRSDLQNLITLFMPPNRYITIGPNSREINATIYDTAFANYPSGTVIYLRAYPISGGGVTGDPDHPGRIYNTGISEQGSDIYSVIVP